ncbi:Type 2A phosphatase-associated protein 42, variant 4 [Entomophthora muscae]|nr:Type 2A phosphatase-associated protein 42, variant 4 [Entomophthora muscae]
MDSSSDLDSGYSLSQLFDNVEQQYRQLDEGHLSNSDPKLQEVVTEALKSLITLQKAITLLCLFSDNEAIDEVNPNYLKFFLVEFYLGQFVTMINARNCRLQNLERAKNHFHNFLSLCDSYSVATPESIKALKTNKPTSIISTREERIERFKKSKELSYKLKELTEKRGSSNSGLEVNNDSDLTKEIYLTMIDFCQQKAVDELISIHQESELLKTMPNEPHAAESTPDIDQLTWRLDSLPSLGSGKSHLLDPQGKPLRPFVITGKQKELREQVFRPSWRLPTMSIEEYLDIEMERGNFLQGGG